MRVHEYPLCLSSFKQWYPYQPNNRVLHVSALNVHTPSNHQNQWALNMNHILLSDLFVDGIQETAVFRSCLPWYNYPVIL